MQGLRKVLERSSLVTCGALWLGLSQCGGTEFSASPGGGASGNDTGGAKPQGGSGGSAAGGSAGSAASAGTGGASGAGGRGGSGPASCECPAGSYCLEGSTTDCLACSDLSRLSFDEPVRLATVSDNGAGSRFPRIGATSTDLVYRFDGVGMRYTADSSTSAGNDVTATEPKDSAPLLLRESVSLPVGDLMLFNFMFDRTELDVRTLRVGAWSDGLQSTRPAGAPFNSGAGDFSVAIALHASPAGARAFWMTNREGDVPLARKPRLLTAPLAANSSAVDVPIALRVGDEESCPLLDVSEPPPEREPIDPDLTPWVTNDGTLLLFSTTRLAAGCVEGSQRKDIYSALLQASTGQPAAPALPMNDVNSPQDDVDPSFSADWCDLYFSSNREGNFAVYRAHRR